MISLIEGDDRGKDRLASCRINEWSLNWWFNGGRVLQGQTRFSLLLPLLCFYTNSN